MFTIVDLSVRDAKTMVCLTNTQTIKLQTSGKVSLAYVIFLVVPYFGGLSPAPSAHFHLALIYNNPLTHKYTYSETNLSQFLFRDYFV